MRRHTGELIGAPRRPNTRLPSLNVPRDAFVATATAIALMVDVARVPVYVFTEAPRLLPLWPLLAVGTVGVLLGTIGGERILRRIPKELLQKVIAAIILALGACRTWFHACASLDLGCSARRKARRCAGHNKRFATPHGAQNGARPPGCGQKARLPRCSSLIWCYQTALLAPCRRAFWPQRMRETKSDRLLVR